MRKSTCSLRSEYEKDINILHKIFNLSTSNIIFSDIEIGYLDVALIANDSVSDLIPKVYEGGFKVWECTQDLADFLVDKSEFEGKRVCDLGCSAGILGILSLENGALSVDFQDYVRLVIIIS